MTPSGSVGPGAAPVGEGSPIARLFALEQFRIKLGLDAMARLLSALGDPQKRWPAVHLAGTNGKGSTSAMVERALRAAGLRTGRYTSPHLLRVEERVAIDGHDIDTAAFSDALARVFAGVDRLGTTGELPHPPTFFEVSTAAAFLAFADAGIDVGVIEVGLGGRFDATNVLVPTVGAITSIDFDHERHLGTTLDAIAREKAGIAKPGVPLVVGQVPEEARRAIVDVASRAGARLMHVADEITCETRVVDGHVVGTFTSPGARYGPLRLALAGEHQAANAAVAVRVVETWATASGRPVGADAVVTGLTDVHWPARLEWLRHRDHAGRVLVDAAHNPAGARALASYLRMAHVPPVTLVTSVMADKDVAGVLGPLAPHVARIVATQADTPRALPAHALAARVATLGARSTLVDVEPDPWRAVTAARIAAGQGPVLLAGSIYLVGPLRAALLDAGYTPTR